MGRSEMLLLLAAIAIFGRYTLTINRTRYNNEFWIIQCENQTMAVSLSEKIMEEAAGKAFDENTVSASLSGGLSGLTIPAQLGSEIGENYPSFNDIDDYHNLSTTYLANNGIQYLITATVGYVDENDIDTFQSNSTYLKRMNVTVTSDFLIKPVILSRIYSYYCK